jgi:lipid-A-disaccharide synthase
MAAPHIVLVAGEASGDLYGAQLARTLRRLCAGVRLSGMGGPAMRAAGVELVADASETAVVGLTELWEKRRAITGAFRKLRLHLAAERPSLFVPIDFPDFNLLLARSARRLAIPICYFISPQVWAWRRGRIHTIRRLVRKILVFFPFEERLYRQAGVDATFIGHPLLDALADVPDRAACRASLQIDQDAGVLGLLPGSRHAELRRLLPLLLESARRVLAARPELQIVLGLAPSLERAPVEAAVRAAGLAVRIVEGRTAEVMRAADLLLAVSGTVTLEAAILGTPLLITYRVGTLTWLIGSFLVRVRWCGLPNLVAERTVVPELVQAEATPERLAAEALRLLERPADLAAMREALAEVRHRLGAPGATERAAREILALIAPPAAGTKAW